jgi:hypothetical protein
MFEKWKTNGGIIGSTDNHKKKKNDVVPCPKKGDVTHALSEAHWQHSAIESFLSNTFCIISFCSALICRWTVNFLVVT